MYYFGSRSKQKLETTVDALQEIFEEAIKHSPLDFGITSGFRTAEEQYVLFQQGASQRDGYEKKSYHQTGCAIDIAVYVNGKITWDETYYKIVAGHILGTAKRLGYELEWGGYWTNFKDYPHFQIRQ